MRLGFKVIEEKIANGMILNGEVGGFVIGNYHADGGVVRIGRLASDIIQIVGEMEGWEYVMSEAATVANRTRLDEINGFYPEEELEDVFDEYELPPDLDLLDMSPNLAVDNTADRWLKMYGDQYIVNKHATKEYLAELDQMNKAARG